MPYDIRNKSVGIQSLVISGEQCI